MAHLFRLHCKFAAFLLLLMVWQNAQAADSRAAKESRAVFHTVVTALEENNSAEARSYFDPAMTGYERAVEKMDALVSHQKQIRYSFSDEHVLAGRSLARISFKWERRSLAMPSMSAVLKSGQCAILLQRNPEGWRIIGLEGDNPFNE